jgi:hypothetical protein
LAFSTEPISCIPPNCSEKEIEEYWEKIERFEIRKHYIDGLHVNSTYTIMAHLWLIKRLINAKNWYFVSDKDLSILTSIPRIFSEEIKCGKAQHFTCSIEKSKTKREAFMKYTESQKDLKKWGELKGFNGLSLQEIAVLKLSEQLQTHSFYNFIEQNGKEYPFHANNPIEHPLPAKDEGTRYVDCLTNLLGYSLKEIAELIVNVNSFATNAFFQQIRRRLSFLERPLLTASGEGVSYIYANFNPKYAQYALTILRTFYNFCLPYKTPEKLELTPAQQLGIADRLYDLKDVIYFK